MTPSEIPTRVPIARRRLERSDGSIVELALHAPTPDPESDGGDWVCEVEVFDSSRATVHRGHGVDSLQALVSGLAVLREAIKARGARDLSWLGQKGVVGLPLVVQEHDEDFLTLVETAIALEHMRVSIQRKCHPAR